MQDSPQQADGGAEHAPFASTLLLHELPLPGFERAIARSLFDVLEHKAYDREHLQHWMQQVSADIVHASRAITKGDKELDTPLTRFFDRPGRRSSDEIENELDKRRGKSDNESDGDTAPI